MSDEEAVHHSSGNSTSSEEHGYITTRLKSMNLDRTRIAKKSTAVTESKYATLTKRQAAIASKDKTKEFAKILNAEVNAVDNESTVKRRVDKKVIRKIPGAIYDYSGVHIQSGKDLCDCLQLSCPGCHFPCPKCSSEKCGLDCRCYRKFMYDMIEYHGYEFVIQNPIN